VSPGSSSEKAIISVEVIEAPTGSLNFGAGYSTDTKLTGSLSLTERNLLGKGQKLNLQLSTSRNSNSLNFSFLEPSFLNREVSAGINLSLKQTDPSESTYSSNSFSLSPSLGFIVGPDSKMNLSYKIESLEINSENSLSAVLRSDDGHFINSSISSSFVFDKRDSMIEPKNGYILRLKNTLSGIGGDVGYIKNSLRTKFHKSFLSDKLVLSAEFEGGSLRTFTGYSRITDRFKLGGRNLRGFQFGESGPRDIQETP
jgi:Outer membrane protein/protective antigen OMA87